MTVDVVPSVITYNHMMMDISLPRHDWVKYPTQDGSVPLYLGCCPSVPQKGGTLTHGYPYTKDYEVVDVVEVGHRNNPFNVPVVVIRRIKKSK